jgi:trehalose-6-phosphatase
MVIELAVVSTHKGDALDTMRKRFGASAVLFLGDDVTDEDAFKTLAGPDVGVKVGDGESVASLPRARHHRGEPRAREAQRGSGARGSGAPTRPRSRPTRC